MVEISQHYLERNSIVSLSRLWQLGLAILLSSHRLPHHNIHSKLLAGSALQEDLLPNIKPKFGVDDDIDIMRALKVTRKSVTIGLRPLVGN